MVKLKLARAYSHPQSTSHSMGREKTEAVRRKIIKMSEKEKRVNVLLSGDYINILKNDVSS